MLVFGGVACLKNKCRQLFVWLVCEERFQLDGNNICNVFSIGACCFCTEVKCWMFFVVESAENKMPIKSVWHRHIISYIPK